MVLLDGINQVIISKHNKFPFIQFWSDFSILNDNTKTSFQLFNLKIYIINQIVFRIQLHQFLKLIFQVINSTYFF